MRDAFIVLLLLCCFLAWLIAEWRGERWLRMSLGLLCMLVLFIGIYVVVQSAGMQSAMYHIGLQQIDRAVQQGDLVRARRAIWIYDETLTQTGSPKAAITNMLKALEEGED